MDIANVSRETLFIEPKSMNEQETQNGGPKPLVLELDKNKENTVPMEIDDIDDYVVDTGAVNKFSVTDFLREVFKKELGHINGCDHKVVVIAVDAILKDSGFLCLDTVSTNKTDGFYPLRYTLPETAQTVTLMVHSSGKDVVFYGSLVIEGSDIYWVRFDEDRLEILLNLIWANLDTAFVKIGTDFKEAVSVFWLTLKDRLALPLLIDLCKIANLASPSCFAGLPDDMKLAILELLPAADVARASRISRDLRVLSSSDDLWKKKFFKEFGNADVAEAGEGCWKKKFAISCEIRNRREAAIRYSPPFGGSYFWPHSPI